MEILLHTVRKLGKESMKGIFALKHVTQDLRIFENIKHEILCFPICKDN